MERIKLNLASVGDPGDRKTWSGTPFNIMHELLRQERLGVAFNSMATNNKFNRLLVRLVSNIYYGNSVDLTRGYLHRYLNSRKVIRITSESGTKRTLHTGTLALPFVEMPENQRHFLYCDSTWDIRARHLKNRAKYSDKLLKDAEDLEKRSYEQMEHVFTTGEYVRQNLIDHYGLSADRITAVGTGLGVITPFFGEKDYSCKKILFVAKREFEDKGGYLVLEAFKIAYERARDIELTIVGQDKYLEQMHASGVKISGFIQVQELQELFNNSSLFILPAFYEPWGLVYLEAMACGLPIIGFNRNSFPEISANGKYGFGLNSDNPEELAEIILNAFSDPERLSEMGQNAQKYCLDKFSWEYVVARIVQVIEKLG